MSVRRPATRLVALDRALERLPLFRLSDSAADDGALQWVPAAGTRWRVLPAPGDRLPGTFDQDVWVGLLHRWAEAGRPDDGAITFRLHAFLRSLGRKADGRTYEQLRASLTRLERTTLESTGVYGDGDARFTLLASVVIERRRQEDADQLALFPTLTANEPGDARVTLSPQVRGNLAAGAVAELSWARYQQLASPVARRLYRLLSALAPEAEGEAARWPLEQWAERLPLAQRYPSHLQRVLQPAHEMLVSAGVVRGATVVTEGRDRWVEYRW
ncbi:replication initiator protein A [Roseisolibacter sp. H3M3-2]|uniref:replication initiator protein A n=1 Tax=Roseisolibacter sp. H3M3-2 TaxID=3031323 RepID=UPI0023D991B0|nr:replication initiator protein A [Roseisolibacter sp. H3M3-2]MDF1503992.1 replication initiator protein A [Roseisolibacter sp. H3M3-2]